MANLVLLNNFLHDFSAAGWIFCTVILWQLFRKSISLDVPTADILRTIRQLMILSLIGIVVFGITRALAYEKYEWNEAAGDAQVKLLIIKHIILTVVFMWGVYYYRKAGKFLQESTSE